jgi:hypothetical protein
VIEDHKACKDCGERAYSCKPALTEREWMEFELGTLEAFNTDGLGSIVHHAPSPIRKKHYVIPAWEQIIL